MNAKNWLAVLCLVIGVPLAAYGLANGAPVPALVGLALVLGFWGLVWQWIAQRAKPGNPIRPAADAAWNMKDQPPPAAPRE